MLLFLLKLLNCYFVLSASDPGLLHKISTQIHAFKQDIEMSSTEQVTYIVEKGLSMVRTSQYWYVRDEH